MTTGSAASIATIAADAQLDEIVRPGIDLPSGAPKEYGKVMFVSADGAFASGVWRGEAGTIPIASYPVDEHCTLLDGEVVLTDANGNSETFTAGMTFVVPVGFQGTWHMPVASSKLFACHGTAETVGLMLGADTKSMPEPS